MKKEEWKDIPTYEFYQASSFGRIRSKKRKVKNKGTYGGWCTFNSKILKQYIDNMGYYFVVLCINGKTKRIRVHRLIAFTFLDNANNYNEVNHIDGNKLNNHIENLEFCSHKHNMQEAWNLNLISRCHKKGKEHHRSITVLQYDINGNFIKEWECIRQVEKELGICNQNISKCCKGKYKTCGGYIWKYKHHQEVHSNKHKWQTILKEMNK